jgi:TonB family protein
MAMANFFSKYFSEIALMAAAVLWAGCGDFDKDSKNEKLVSNDPVESPDSMVLQNVAEKDDSLANVVSRDSFDANPQTVVLQDSAKLLEVQRTRDSLMKTFFPIERIHKEKKKWGLRYDIGRLLSYGSAKRRDSVRTNLFNIGTKICYDGVVAPRSGFEKDGLLQVFLRNTNMAKLRGTVKVLYENIEFADKQTLNQDLFYRVKRVIRLRTSGLRHVYGKFLKKNPDNSFEGEIILKLTIAADGCVKESSIKKSTTGVKEFDENIRKAVSRWIFSKVDSGTTVVYVPIHFYEDARPSSQPK